MKTSVVAFAALVWVAAYWSVTRAAPQSAIGGQVAAGRAPTIDYDLSLEPRRVYDTYNTGRFGQGCLLARRLVEAGARYVEVTTVHHDRKSRSG